MTDFETEHDSARRIDVVEERISQQAALVRELQAHSAKTDESIAGIVTTLERLAVELARRPAVPHRTRSKRVWIGAAGALIAIVAALVMWQITRTQTARLAHSGQSAQIPPRDQARQYANARDYAKAEAIYREMVVKNPKDPEAIKGLASMLFRQDKIEESANVLRALAVNRATAKLP